jgi:hypothetical protein
LNLALSLGFLWVFDVANHFLGLVEGKMSDEKEANRERERERCYREIEGKMSGEREADRE